MKKLFFLLSMVVLIGCSAVFAQDTSETEPANTTANTTTTAAAPAAAAGDNAGSFSHEKIKQLFIDGGPTFMSLVLLCLILGLAFAIERIISLNLATTNPNTLLKKLDTRLSNGDVDGAKELCRSTRGPVASIFYQGLLRSNEGIENVEKAVVSYGSVQMGKLERGLIWLGLFIALAPMLGFMGTVLGMINAFNDIEVKGTIEPSGVARGIKIALITTVSGLFVAIILQIFYNYLISKIDGIVNRMEDATISFVDLLIKHNAVKR